MPTITIRGRIATTVLKRGETVTVERTDQVDKLIEEGFVEVVHTDSEPEPVATITSNEDGKDEGTENNPASDTVASRRRPKR